MLLSNSLKTSSKFIKYNTRILYKPIYRFSTSELSDLVNKSNYYEILDVKPNADIKEIKKAFRNLAKKYHPDVTGDTNTEEDFKKVVKAYHTLSNKVGRQVYDLNMNNENLNTSGFDATDFDVADELRMGKNSQKYYQNKYYNHTKPKDDLRNEEYEKWRTYDFWNEFSSNMWYKLAGIVGIIIAVDLYQWRKEERTRRITVLRNEVLNSTKTQLQLANKNYNNVEGNHDKEVMDLEDYIIGRMLDKSIDNESDTEEV